MINTQANPHHNIQRYILDVLRHNQYARFRDLRPPKVDSNAFSYHLTQLVRQGFLVKTAQGYTLSLQGIAYIDRVSRLDTRPRVQPKIMTITALYNQYGQVLVYAKKTQPMIGQLTFPTGMLHLEDASITSAALREVYEKTGIQLPRVEHVGDCYMAVRSSGTTIMNALMHVFIAHVDGATVILPPGAQWVNTEQLTSQAAPATIFLSDTITKRKPGERFFEEYAVDW